MGLLAGICLIRFKCGILKVDFLNAVKRMAGSGTPLKIANSGDEPAFG